MYSKKRCFAPRNLARPCLRKEEGCAVLLPTFFEIEWKKQPFPCRVSEKNGVTLYSYKKREEERWKQKKAPQIPYGISDFVRMRTENYYYVDKTMYLPLIEDTASYIFMIHPRRFGKSLFLSIMKAYYDILQKDRFESYSADYE